MKNITQVTENRIKKMVREGHKFGECFAILLDDMKARIHSCGLTVAEIKKYNYDTPYLENETQIEFFKWYGPLYRGLEYAFPELIGVVDCLNLHYLNIYDFNKLVKLVSELPDNGYCYF